MKIFVTGGIGSGKSTFTGILEERGAAVILADLVGHANLHDPETKGLLVQAFGPEILASTGEVSRPALAARAFVSEESTHLLDSITQPRLYAKCLDLIAQLEEGNDVVVMEMAILDGRDDFYRNADVVVCVTADTEERVKRLVATRGIPEDDARNRIARQAAADEGRLSIADFVISNNGTLEELMLATDAFIDEAKVPLPDGGVLPAADVLSDASREKASR